MVFVVSAADFCQKSSVIKIECLNRLSFLETCTTLTDISKQCQT